MKSTVLDGKNYGVSQDSEHEMFLGDFWGRKIGGFTAQNLLEILNQILGGGFLGEKNWRALQHKNCIKFTRQKVALGL